MTFTLSYDNQTINAEVITSTFSKTEVYWNKLKQADNSARFQAVFTIELSNFIKANINNDIQVTIADGDTNVFFGYVRKNVRFTKTQINQPVSIEVVSPSFILDKSIGKNLNYVNKTLGYIVEDLLSRAEFNSTQGLSSLSYSPRLISVTEEETFKEVITELLYEYGYGWDFDASGVFFVYELFTTPTIAEVTNTFDGSNCLNQIDITAKDSEYDCVKGEFSEITQHTNALIFTDTTGGSSQSKCSQPVLSHKYFADKQYNYLDCDSEFGEIKFISSVTPDVTASNGPHMSWQMSDKELDSTSPNYNLPLGTQLCFTAYNSAGDTNYLTKIDCKANILVGNTKTSAISYGNKKTNEISLKYICEESKASSFVQNLTNWYRYSNNTISLTSKTNYALGSFVKVTDYGIGTYYGRIIQKTTNLVTDSISYIIETFEDFTAATVDTKSTPAIGGLNQSSIQSAINQSNSYTDNRIEEVELEASPQYSVIYNSPVIRKGNDGSYTPSVITAKSYKTQDESQSLFSGDFIIKVNGQSYGTITGSSISLSVNDLLAEYDSLDTIEIAFQTSGVSPIVISQYTIPVISGASAYSVTLETPSTVFEGNENGVVSAHTVTTKAHVYYGLQELEYLGENGWEYGAIEPPEGFTVSVNATTGVISITNEAGNIPEYGKITIPVFIHSQTNTEYYAGYVGEQRSSVIYYSGYGDHFEGYLTPDENGYFNAYFTWVKVTETAIKLSQLDTKVNGYWNTLTSDLVITVPEKNTLARIRDGFTAEHTIYAQKYSTHRNYSAYNTAYNNVVSAINTILSYDGNYTFNGSTEKNTFNGYFSTYYSTKESLDSEIATVGTNFTGVDTVNEVNSLAASAKVGDYFVWTGDNNTEAGGVTFVTGMTYCWNGTWWEQDDNNEHVMATMSEAMAYLSNNSNESIPAVTLAKRLVAMKVVTDELFANYVEIKNTLNIRKEGLIKSQNWNGTLTTTLFPDENTARTGDYFLKDNVYNFITSLTPFTYLATLEQRTPTQHYVEFIESHGNVKQITKTVEGETLHVTAGYAQYHGGWVNTDDFYLYKGDVYSDFNCGGNVASLLGKQAFMWNGEELISLHRDYGPAQNLVHVSDVKQISTHGTEGFIELADGEAEFNGKMRATNLEITGESTFNGTGTFTGTVHATDGEFTGTVNATSGSFTGTVNASDGTFNGTVNASAGVFNNVTINESCIMNKSLGKILYENRSEFSEYSFTPSLNSMYVISHNGAVYGNPPLVTYSFKPDCILYVYPVATGFRSYSPGIVIFNSSCETSYRYSVENGMLKITNTTSTTGLQITELKFING